MGRLSVVIGSIGHLTAAGLAARSWMFLITAAGAQGTVRVQPPKERAGAPQRGRAADFSQVPALFTLKTPELLALGPVPHYPVRTP